jgi:hypothetical protein
MAVSRINYAIEIPKWLTEVNPNSALNARDVRQLFNIASGTLVKHKRAGIFPQCDFETHGQHTYPTPSEQWYVKTILAFIKHHHDLQSRQAGVTSRPA